MFWLLKPSEVKWMGITSIDFIPREWSKHTISSDFVSFHSVSFLFWFHFFFVWFICNLVNMPFVIFVLKQILSYPEFSACTN